MAEATYGGVRRDESNRRPEEGEKARDAWRDRKEKSGSRGEAGESSGRSEKASQRTGFTGKRDYDWRDTAADHAAEKDHVARRSDR
jgi:hypothetical protein